MNDKYAIENEEAYNYECDPTIIFDASFFKYLFSTNVPKETPPLVNPEECHPCTNSYYQFAEDYDAVARIPHLLHERESLEDEPECINKKSEKDAYLEYYAFLQYLESKPVSFVVLGKPEMGESKFAKALAEFWRCVYIDPLSLIEEEIQSGSRAGTCIEFNLRNGKSIGIDIILRLLHKKLKDASVQHRGFILSGFPLVPNDIFSENKIFSENAIKYAQDIFEDIFETSLNYEERKNVSRASRQASKEDLNTNEPEICFDSSYYVESKDQVDFIFTLIKEYFYLIIYMKCANDEVVNIHENNYIDSHSYISVNLLEKSHLYFESYGNPSNTKLLKLQSDYPTYVKSQLAHYQYEFEAAIEKYILLQNPEYIIRVDARMSTHKLIDAVKLRLKLLPLSKPLIPKKLLEDNSQEEFGEDFNSPKPKLNIDNDSPEEWYNTLNTLKIPGLLYKWNLSNWGYQCPVAMYDGNNTTGNPNLATQFLDKIFFLSSEEAFNRFMDDPKLFLKPPNPKHYRKIYIFGPKNCGKSALAKTLGRILDCTVFMSDDILQNYMNQKHQKLLSNARTSAEIEAIDLLKQKRRETYFAEEETRKKKVEEFVENLKSDLRQYLECYQVTSNFDEIEVTALPAPRYREKSLLIIECETIIKKLNQKFKEKNIPIGDINLYTTLLSDDAEMEKYFPTHLQEPTVFKFDIISRKHPFVVNYLKTKLLAAQDSILNRNLDLDTLIKSYKDVIQMDMSGGWIIDSLPVNIEFIEQLLFELPGDLIIIFIDQTSNFDHLKKIYERGVPIDIESFEVGEVSQTRFSEVLAIELDEAPESTPKEAEDDQEYLNKFRNNYESLIKFLQSNNIHYFECNLNGRPIKNIIEEAINEIHGKNIHEARKLEPGDELQGNDLEGPGYDEEEPGEFDEMETEKVADEDRRLGDTNIYCPIAYFDHEVIWKGKNEYVARYKNKIHYFSSEEALNKFITTPWKYEFIDNPTKPPPPRVCIAGVKRSGKTSLAQAISRNLGLIYVNFETKLLESLTIGDGNDLENYLVSDVDVPDDILQKILFPLWFDEPAKSIGFVIDDFPNKLNQINFLCRNFLVPEIILYLDCNQELLNERLLQVLLDEWQLQMDNEKFEHQTNYNISKNTWDTTREKRKAELLEERKDLRYNQRVATHSEEEDFESAISVRSIEEAEDLKEIEGILNYELPEPILNENWETFDEARTRLQFAVERENLEYPQFVDIKDQCETELITWVDLDGNKSVDNILVQALLKLVPLKYKSESFFERLYDVSVPLADKLLDDGYYFLSRFGRVCPVQIYEDFNLMPLALVAENRLNLFPIIHRNYIYFIVGADNRKKFIENVFRYIHQDNSYLPIPLIRLAIIGPPDTGKTHLSKRFEYEYGLKHVSVCNSIRYVLDHLSKTVLARKVDDWLRTGDTLPEDLVIKCIEAFSFENVAAGVVMDGIPKSTGEMKGLAKLNLLPHLILELYSDQFIANSNHDNRNECSYKLVFKRFMEWNKVIGGLRSWVFQEYQNILRVLANQSKWRVWSFSNNSFLDVVFEIKYYYKKVNQGALRIAHMLVTPYEFAIRQSSFKSYCPCCLFYNNKLITGGNPVNRKGLVQFKYNYYWICAEHIAEFIANPDAFLDSNIKHALPSVLPKKIKLEELPENIFEQGDCAVCLKDNQRKKGELTITAEFNNLVYIFDKEECLKEFLALPFDYSMPKTELGIDHLPRLELNDLPVLGYLEQFDSNLVVQALIDTNSLRPLIPGLDIKTSALINIGLFLKIKNPNTSERERNLYKLSRESFTKSRDDLVNCLARMKKTINPYLNYEERQPRLNLSVSKAKTSSSLFQDDLVIHMMDARRVPVPDERFDYLCEYFKPASKVPAFLNVVDIAGLVKGASEGQGLGNAFLSHISACDTIFHLCRVFDDEDVIHVEGDVNPVRDLEIISEELRLKDEESLTKKLESLEKTVVRGNDKKSKPEYDTLLKIKGVLVDEKNHLRFHDWNTNDIEILNKHLFLTSKPVIYLVNLSEKDYIKKKNKWLIKIKEWVDKNDPGAVIIPFSGAFEFKLLEMDEVERKKYLEDNNTTSALDKIIVQGYKALQLEYFFTSGADEVKAWTIQKGTKAPQAAGRIHTDFEKGFIMAEVMKFVDFKEEGSETAVKAAGKYRQQGRNYTVEDGDIIFFKFNAGAGLKDAKKK